MEDQFREILEFLGSPRADVRFQAVKILSGFSSEACHEDAFCKVDAIPKFVPIIDDSPQIAELSLKALVNLSGSEKCREIMLKSDVIRRAMGLLRDSENPHHSLAVMLLSNLTLDTDGQTSLLQVGETLEGLNVLQLVKLFAQPIQDGIEDKYGYVAEILCNITGISEGRQLVLDPKREIFPHIAGSFSSINPIRRRGAINAARNCCYDKEKFNYLTSPEAGLIEAALISLAECGSGIDDEDRSGLLPAVLRVLTPEKLPEHCAENRRHILDIIQLLCAVPESRTYLKSVGTYFILRELHKWETDEASMDFIEDLVQYFIADETDMPPKIEEIKEDEKNNPTETTVLDEEKEQVNSALSEEEEEEDSDAELEREIAEYQAMKERKRLEALRLAEGDKQGSDSESDSE
eukprot:471250_1